MTRWLCMSFALLLLSAPAWAQPNTHPAHAPLSITVTPDGAVTVTPEPSMRDQNSRDTGEALDALAAVGATVTVDAGTPATDAAGNVLYDASGAYLNLAPLDGLAYQIGGTYLFGIQRNFPGEGSGSACRPWYADTIFKIINAKGQQIIMSIPVKCGYTRSTTSGSAAAGTLVTVTTQTCTIGPINPAAKAMCLWNWDDAWDTCKTQGTFGPICVPIQ